jgi:beta-glucosidase
MKAFGMGAHDFSIAWSRVLPEGDGEPNERGLDFYDRFVDALLAAGVEPWATLYHWDLPLALYRRGGWLNRDSANWFGDYAALVVDRLSDRVSHWVTFEETESIIWYGYAAGVDAPGDTLALPELLVAAHNLLRAHGTAVQAVRASAKQPVKVGATPGASVGLPATGSPEDIEAARTQMFSVRTRDLDHIAWWYDPIFSGHYPEEGLELFGADAPPIEPGDMETIAQPVDFCGTAIFASKHTRDTGSGGIEILPYHPGMPRSSIGWAVLPEALYWGPRHLFERYGTPVLISGNDMAGHEWVTPDGLVHDHLRIDFMRQYLLQLECAIMDGIPVVGYFHWTWLDNFEISVPPYGFSARFGLVHCDFETLERTPKDSAYWYRDVIRTNGVSLHAAPALGS